MSFNYTLIRSSRRTICISVSEGKITVRCPYRTSVAEIERVLTERERWLNKQLSYYSNELPFAEYKSIFVKGQETPLNIIKGCAASIGADGVFVPSVSAIKNLYIGAFGKEFLDLFNEVSRVRGLSYKSVGFKSYKSRWGCCDKYGNITFNYKLLMLPVELWKCVIVHELAHTVVMNHSAAFYKVVERVMPNYKKVHGGLKSYGFICRLY